MSEGRPQRPQRPQRPTTNSQQGNNVYQNNAQQNNYLSNQQNNYVNNQRINQSVYNNMQQNNGVYYVEDKKNVKVLPIILIALAAIIAISAIVGAIFFIRNRNKPTIDNSLGVQDDLIGNNENSGNNDNQETNPNDTDTNVEVEELTDEEKQRQYVKSLAEGYGAAMEEEQDALLKNTPSDIAGMTQYDKKVRGLIIENGSDTDEDGLTDKEEIEVYHSDPLKISTSGDDISDGYKVENGLDINTRYDSTDFLNSIFNVYPEITFLNRDVENINVGVEKVENTKFFGRTVVFGYRIYSYVGDLEVDFSSYMTDDNFDYEVYRRRVYSPKTTFNDYTYKPMEDGKVVFSMKDTDAMLYFVLVKTPKTADTLMTVTMDLEDYQNVLDNVEYTNGVYTWNFSDSYYVGGSLKTCETCALYNYDYHFEYSTKNNTYEFFDDSEVTDFLTEGTTAGFTMEDVPRFANFGDWYSPNGLCMGFAKLVMDRFNHGGLNDAGDLANNNFNETTVDYYPTGLRVYYRVNIKDSVENEEYYSKVAKDGFEDQHYVWRYTPPRTMEFADDISSFHANEGINFWTNVYNLSNKPSTSDIKSERCIYGDFTYYYCDTFPSTWLKEGQSVNTKDKQFLDALHYEFVLGNRAYSRVSCKESISKSEWLAAVEKIQEYLSSGKIGIVSLKGKDNNGKEIGHAINFVGLSQDSSDSNIWYLNVWDSNLPLDGDNTIVFTVTGSKVKFIYPVFDSLGYNLTSIGIYGKVSMNISTTYSEILSANASTYDTSDVIWDTLMDGKSWSDVDERIRFSYSFDVFI